MACHSGVKQAPRTWNPPSIEMRPFLSARERRRSSGNRLRVSLSSIGGPMYEAFTRTFYAEWLEAPHRGPSTLRGYPLVDGRMRRRSPRNGIDHSSFGTFGVATWPLRHLWGALCAGNADGGAARIGARVRRGQ